MVDALALAEYLLALNQEKTDVDGEDAASDITHLKLQKLLYYCQGYALGLYGEPLFGDSIEAWAQGPVVRHVYDTYKKFGSSCIPFNDTGKSAALDERAKNIAGWVMRDKGRYSAWALRDMTHEEKPWKMAYCQGRNTPLENGAIKDFFDSFFEGESDDDVASFMSAGTVPTADEWGKIHAFVGSL